MVTDSRINTLIFAEPGLLCDSILSILGSFPFINVVGTVSVNCRGLDAIKQFCPNLVLLDCSTNNGPMELIRAIHNGKADIKCLAIADTFQTSRLAFENGANAALIKGFTSQDLQLALRRVFFNSTGVDISSEVKNE
jgi:DNA-binding NarL/FixJ family response regulator